MASERARRVGAYALGETHLSIRAFFGLPLPEEHRERLGDYLLRRYALSPKLRWTRPENLHVTLRFLGQVDPSVAEKIAGRVEAQSPRAFTLQLGGMDAFKRGRLARVLWLGLKLGEAEVRALAAQVEAESATEGLEGEKRTYHPHVTLARARHADGAPIPLEAPAELPPWRADEVILYRSHLGRAGAVYEPLRVIRLG